MALIATAVGIAVLPQFTQARQRAGKPQRRPHRATIDSAVQLRTSMNTAATTAPTVEEPPRGRAPSEAARKNSHRRRGTTTYVIECERRQHHRSSPSGADGQPGTEDDIELLSRDAVALTHISPTPTRRRSRRKRRHGMTLDRDHGGHHHHRPRRGACDLDGDQRALTRTKLRCERACKIMAATRFAYQPCHRAQGTHRADHV